MGKTAWPRHGRMALHALVLVPSSPAMGLGSYELIKQWSTHECRAEGDLLPPQQWYSLSVR